MKFIIPTLRVFAVFGSMMTVSAEAANSQFTCTYKPGNRTDIPAQTITFRGPKGIDLANPSEVGPLDTETISLYKNGSLDPVLFNVKKIVSSMGFEVVYSHKSQFFASDLTVRYYRDVNANKSFTGTWEVDHPPVIEMECKFSDDNRFTSLGNKRYVFIDGVCWDNKAWAEVPISFCERN